MPSLASSVPSGTEYPPFTIALEYAIPGLAAAYTPTGVTYAKPQPIFGKWGLIQPAPGQYNWGPLNNLVIEYQTAGFIGIQLLITAESPWASVNPPALLNPGNTFPKEEYLDEYAAFVARFVERYDGDATDDAPGLLYPIHHYGIEREFTGFWPGSKLDLGAGIWAYRFTMPSGPLWVLWYDDGKLYFPNETSLFRLHLGF